MAIEPEDRSSRPPRSWRQSARATGQGGASRRLGRWTLTFLTLGLCIAFALLLWQGREPSRHLIALTIARTDQLTAPAIAYATRDVEALRSLMDHDERLDQIHIADAASLGGLGKQIENLIQQRVIKENRDVLMVYLNAHGVSDNGKAYLLCSDFMRSSATSGQGKYAIADLLQDVSQDKSPVALKLLILDAGRLSHDPRIGMIVNEFPRLVQQEVAKLGDQELWVLLSHSVFQTSRVDHARGQSVFVMALIEALAGAADADEDGYVSLPELYRSVTRRCEELADEIGVPVQVPVLMKAGHDGLVTDLTNADYDEKELRLISTRGRTVPATSDEAAATDENESDEQGDSEREIRKNPGQPSATSTKPGASPPSVADQAEGKPSEKEPVTNGEQEVTPGRDGADRQYFAAIVRAWELRDAIQDRQGNVQGWSPVDFAPHLWRRLNGELLYHEQLLLSNRPHQGLASETDVTPQRPAQIKPLVADLQRLASNLSPGESAEFESPVGPSPEREADIGYWLDRAWRRFEASNEKRTFEQTSLTDLANAIRDYHEVVFHLTDYAKLYNDSANLLVTASGQEPVIQSLLDDLIPFRQMLDAAPGQFLDPADEKRMLDLHKKFTETHRRARQELDRLAEEAITARSRGRSATGNALGRIESETSQHRIESLLATPILSAPMRLRLLEALIATEGTHVSDGRPTDRSTGSEVVPRPKGTPNPWRWLETVAQVDVKRVQLADQNEAETIQPRLRNIVARPDEPSADRAQLWEGYRSLGSGVGDFYARLPRRIQDWMEGSSSDRSASEHFAMNQLLRAVDPRDALRIDRWPFPVIPVRRMIADQVWLDQDNERFRLEDGEAVVELSIHGTRRELLEEGLECDIDPHESEIIEIVEKSEEPVSRLAQDGGRTGYTLPLRVHVRAKTDREHADSEEIPIVLTVTWHSNGQRRTVAERIFFVLPPPDRVDVVVRPRYDTLQPLAAYDEAGDSVTLKLPPNRAADFQISLVNRSGRERNVVVQILATPSRSDVAPGRIDEATRQLLSEVNPRQVDADKFPLLAEAALTLAAGDEPQVVPFGSSQTSEAESEKPAEPAQDGTGDASPPPSTEVEVSGLVCVVLDPDAEKWIGRKWIELDCLTPEEYVSAGVSYQSDTILLDFHAQDRNDDGVPDVPVDPPVDIQWTDPVCDWLRPDYVAEGAKHIRIGQIAPDRLRESLWAEVPPSDKLSAAEVYCQVDGYPRAFHHRITLRDGERGVDRKRTSARIKITSVSVPGYPIVYYWPTSVPLWTPPPSPEGGKPDDKPEKLQHIPLSPGEPAIFPAPVPTLRVRFQVDVPVDAWVDPRDAIEIGLRDERGDVRHSRRFRAERQQVVWLLSTEPSLRLRMDVSDYDIMLPIDNVVNQKWVIKARLSLPRILDREDDGPVLFDGAAPVIDEVTTRSISPEGTLEVRVRVDDLSGVRRVEFGFEKKQLTQRDLASNDVDKDADDRYSFSLRLSVKDDLKGLQPAQYVDKPLYVRVWDKAGRPSTLVEAPVRIRRPAESAHANTTVLEGVIKFGPAAVNGILFTLTIDGPGIASRKVEVTPRGTFRIPGLRPGQYTVKAAGFYRAKRVEGEQKIEIPPAPPPITTNVEVQVGGIK